MKKNLKSLFLILALVNVTSALSMQVAGPQIALLQHQLAELRRDLADKQEEVLVLNQRVIELEGATPGGAEDSLCEDLMSWLAFYSNEYFQRKVVEIALLEQEIQALGA